ncbi:MAG: hypothetical protein LM517_12190 [Nitrosomonas sp.]|nr:hypothetical protein [Nitrosomonas sp.]
MRSALNEVFLVNSAQIIRVFLLAKAVNQHQISAVFENIISEYDIYYSYRTMEYEFMLKILMLISGKFSTPIDTR